MALRALLRPFAAGGVIGTGFILANSPFEMSAALVAAGCMMNDPSTVWEQLATCAGFVAGGWAMLSAARVYPQIGRGKFGGDPHAAFRKALAERRARQALAAKTRPRDPGVS